jgi:hypothetical protein
MKTGATNCKHKFYIDTPQLIIIIRYAYSMPYCCHLSSLTNLTTVLDERVIKDFRVLHK